MKMIWKLLGTTAVVSALVTSSTAQAELYAHWPLDDGDGDIAVNAVEGGFDGFIFDWDVNGLSEEGTVWVNDPDRGTVLGLNGQSQWVEAGFIPIMDLENQHTWAFWSRVPPEQASPNNDIIIGNRWGEDGTDTSPREFIKFTTNRFEYHMNGGFGDDLAYADSNMPIGQWIHNSVVKQGDTLTYYRDGEFRNETTISGGQISDEPLTLGFGGDVGSEGGQAWRGSLSDVQLYTKALTPSEIAITMEGNLLDDNLYAHYPLNDGGDVEFAMGTGPGAVDGGALIDNIDAGLGPDGSVWVDDPERGTVLGLAGTFVDAGELPLMDLESDFTWNFWSNADAGQNQTSNSVIIGNRNDFNGNDSNEFIKFTNDRIEYHADGTSDSDLEWGPAGPEDIVIPNNDEWLHHVVVKDGDELRYYRNGEVRNEIQLGLGQQSDEELPFALGGQNAFDTPGRETSVVFLSDVRLYDNALTGAEVAELAGIELSACNPNTLGDIDGSGDVAFADFLILSQNFGQAATDHTTGDIDCSGDVAFADFLVLSQNFGQTVGGAESVPEPSTLGLFGISALFLGCLRRRRN